MGDMMGIKPTWSLRTDGHNVLPLQSASHHIIRFMDIESQKINPGTPKTISFTERLPVFHQTPTARLGAIQ